MRRHLPALAALAGVLLVGGPAAADSTPPGCTRTCGGAAFSPALSDSPVTVVLCTVPGSCAITPPGGGHG